MDEELVHDDKLFAILKECRNLPNFLNVVFGFLKRRTDFYHIATEPNAVIGLPEGIAEGFVKEIFYKWKLLDKPKKLETVEQHMVPSAITEVTIEDTEILTESSNTHHKTNIDVEVSPTGFTSSESYNGAVYDNYSWSQTITDIDIVVKVPQSVTSKDLFVKILPQKISIKLKDGNVLLEGELCQKVKHNDAIWSLDKQNLEIHLDKTAEFWWNCLVTHEPKINVKNIDCSRPYNELSDEAQAKIDELQWNQEQKRLGLPTSDELVFRNKLKNAWNAEGSPFKGPFDPSTVAFQH